MNVDEIGAMWAPEGFGIERGVQFFEGAVVGAAFDFRGGDGDQAILDGGENHVFGIDQQQALLRLDQHLHRLRGGRFAAVAKLIHQLLEPLRRTCMCLNLAPRALNGLGDTRLVKRLQHVVHGVHIEGLHRKMVERRGKYYVRNFHFALDELFEDAEAVQAGHFYVEKHQIRRVLLDQRNRFQAVLTQPNHIYLRKAFEQKCQLLASRLFVVDDNGVDGHGRGRLRLHYQQQSRIAEYRRGPLWLAIVASYAIMRLGEFWTPCLRPPSHPRPAKS